MTTGVVSTWAREEARNTAWVMGGMMEPREAPIMMMQPIPAAEICISLRIPMTRMPTTVALATESPSREPARPSTRMMATMRPLGERPRETRATFSTRSRVFISVWEAA